MGKTKYVEVGVAFPSRGEGDGFVEGEIMTAGNTDARTTALAWLVGALSFAALLGLSPASPVAAATGLQLTYRVTHAVFGDIGTYTNTVESTGDGATVLTRAHFEVSMLGVRMYREDTESTERWQGNRLVSFHGVSDKGDGRAEVKGEARGDNFVITSPRGTVTAPASVQPANPWSANFLGSNTIMHPDTGRVEQVRVSGGEQTTVKIDGASIPARKYDVDGKPRYSVWLDARGVPMMFAIDDDTGKITFTLSKCVRCGLVDLSQMGLRAH